MVNTPTHQFINPIQSILVMLLECILHVTLCTYGSKSWPFNNYLIVFRGFERGLKREWMLRTSQKQKQNLVEFNQTKDIVINEIVLASSLKFKDLAGTMILLLACLALSGIVFLKEIVVKY